MKPYYEHAGISIFRDDCRDVLPTIPSASVDAIVSDPPYPEIDRAYGRLTEAEWHDLMRFVVGEVRRVLKPSGSAVFVLQPNSERVGRMRPWLWEFMAWTAREWNQVQDAWWWNPAAMPTVHTYRTIGLLRPSLKACVWLGPETCYRSQDEVLWTQSAANAAGDREDRAMKYTASGHHTRNGRMYATADERGGVTPFNVIPCAPDGSAGSEGHGAGTPLPLCSWWVRYICPPGGVVLDPFFGVGTVGRAARLQGRRCIGIERMPEYVETAARIFREDGRLSQEVLALGGAA